LLGDSGASITMTRDESGHKANLFATLGPGTDGGIVLAGHSDVVPATEEEWESDPFELRAADGRLYGRGACDMKGFIAAVLATVPRYAQLELKRPVHVALTYDEEVGCFGARQLVGELQHLGVRPAVAIIGEPTEMHIVEGHKGCYEYTTALTGLEAHAAYPEAGVNAIEFAARYVDRLARLASELTARPSRNNRFDPPFTTIQVGRIEGGVARNVIPGHCRIEWEMRPVHTRDADFVKTALQRYEEDELLPAMRAKYADASIVTEVIGELEGLEPVEDGEAQRIVAELVGADAGNFAAFGTEAGVYTRLGLSAVVCGPGSIDQAHKPNEYVAVAQLQACLDMLAGLERKLTV
jgi:acetylornithine deacetylase